MVAEGGTEMSAIMAEEITPKESPRWDMTTVFPSLESAEFAQAFDAALQEMDDLVRLFDKHAVQRRKSPLVDAAFVAAYEEVIRRLSAFEERTRTLATYISCHTTTDACDEIARSKEALFRANAVKTNKLQTRLTAWIGSSDIEALLAQSELARQLEYSVRRAQHQAAHQMSAIEEDLASELAPSSVMGWAKLHSNLTALLTAEVTLRGEQKILPMSAIRSLAIDPDREVRRAGFEAELKAWEASAIPLAAALNGIKGYQQTLRIRRGYTDAVEPTLFNNGIDRQTLEAMQRAVVESFPNFRRYMDAKARALGLERLAWYDVTAPVGAATRAWTWNEAEQFIHTNFGLYSDRLADFAARSFQERWIDAEPRVGKVGGAYCAGIRPGESRILMNYNGSFNSVSTLAHELGHAYHNLNMRDRPPMQRGTPSTLAETASIFCETLAFDAALSVAEPAEQLALLDTVLERNLMVVVDIHSRFLFEKSVFEKRAVRDLTVSEFSALMTEAQRQTYGDNLDPLHPFMWAVKGHYFGPTFYNYPYTFGLLFGLGLYALYRKAPDAFRADYDNFLSSTGIADAKTLAARFGIDTHSVDFWRSSLDVIRTQIAEFERLIEANA